MLGVTLYYFVCLRALRGSCISPPALRNFLAARYSNLPANRFRTQVGRETKCHHLRIWLSFCSDRCSAPLPAAPRQAQLPLFLRPRLTRLVPPRRGSKL